MAQHVEIKDLDLISALKNNDSFVLNDSSDNIAKRTSASQIKEFLKPEIDALTGTIQTNLSSHIENKNNPHEVVANQVKFDDNETFQQKYDSGQLKGQNGTNGANGQDGTNGNDGISPTIAINTNTSDTYILDITDKNGTITTPNLMGSDGKSAYEIAVENGFAETEQDWLDSLVGSDGVNGIDGTNGTNGEDGFSPIITIKENTATTYILTIKTVDDEFDTPNLRGSGTGDGIEEAPIDDQLYGRKNEQWEIIPEIPTSSVALMFFGVEDGNPVASHTSPIEPQTILNSGTHFSASPGTWHDIITFTLGKDLQGSELEFIPGNLFTAKFWIRSDIARSNAQFRLRATNSATGDSLATGTTSVDLGKTGELQPVIITGIYEIPAVVPSEDIIMTLQVLTPEFGVQLGLFSIPPNEISYISRLISGVSGDGGSGIEEAPIDSNYWVRHNANWEQIKGIPNSVIQDIINAN